MPFVKLDVYVPDIIVTNHQRTIFVGLTCDYKIVGETFVSYMYGKDTCEDDLFEIFPHVEIFDNPPLARMLVTTCDIGESIPEFLYSDVEELISAYFLRRRT